MHHAAPHGNRVKQHSVGQADLTQCLDAAHRESEVDRSTAFGIVGAWIGSLFMQINAIAGAAEVASQQRSSKAGTNDRDLRRFHEGFATKPRIRMDVRRATS